MLLVHTEVLFHLKAGMLDQPRNRCRAEPPVHICISVLAGSEVCFPHEHPSHPHCPCLGSHCREILVSVTWHPFGLSETGGSAPEAHLMHSGLEQGHEGLNH